MFYFINEDEQRRMKQECSVDILAACHLAKRTSTKNNILFTEAVDDFCLVYVA